jgi:hypothetical protein
VTEPIKLPEKFGTTRAFAVLEVCETFGIDPARIDGYNPGLLAMELEYVRVKKQMTAPRIEGAPGDAAGAGPLDPA